MRLLFSPQAASDLEAISDYIAQNSPRQAQVFLRELEQQCARIAVQPGLYRQRPELRQGLRSCPYGNYIIFFLTEARAVRIVRILHQARDLPAILAASPPDKP